MSDEVMRRVWDRAQTVPSGGLLGVWRSEVDVIRHAPEPLPWPWPAPTRSVAACCMVPCIVMDDPPLPNPPNG